MFEHLSTPAVLVDSERLERNIEQAQGRASAAGVRLRPHIKTHRTVEIAQRQLAAGAVGITCAKPSEAAVFVAAGFQDVRLAYPIVGSHRLEQLIDLSQRARVSFCVDSVEAARAASEAFQSAGKTAAVMLKIDCGYGRAGWRWDDGDLPEAATTIAALDAIRVEGVLTHAGQAYTPATAEQDPKDVLAEHALNERDRAQQAARVIGAVLGCEPGSLETSVGSTPTFWSFVADPAAVDPVTEVRPGNYVFHDLTQVDLGAATLDQCALSVLATVVTVRSNQGRLHALIDAGKKTLTSDRRAGQEGYGLVLDEERLRREGTVRARPDWKLHALSEEHGWLDAPLDARIAIGDRLRVLVNHACVVVSTQRVLIEVVRDTVVGSIDVSASGCSTT